MPAEPAVDDLPLTPPAPGGNSAEALLDAVARQRDRAAFAALFELLAPRLKSYLQRLGSDPGQAEELVQEAMLTVWHRAPEYDPTRAAVSTWVFTIARNLRIDAFRRERRPEFDPADPLLVPDAEPLADRHLETQREGARLRAAIGALPPEQAALLQLAFFEEMSHSDIVVRLGLPLGTVKSRLRLALERLRRILGDVR